MHLVTDFLFWVAITHLCPDSSSNLKHNMSKCHCRKDHRHSSASCPNTSLWALRARRAARRQLLARPCTPARPQALPTVTWTPGAPSTRANTARPWQTSPSRAASSRSEPPMCMPPSSRAATRQPKTMSCRQLVSQCRRLRPDLKVKSFEFI